VIVYGWEKNMSKLARRVVAEGPPRRAQEGAGVARPGYILGGLPMCLLIAIALCGPVDLVGATYVLAALGQHERPAPGHVGVAAGVAHIKQLAGR
jgi:hypothetical protein